MLPLSEACGAGKVGTARLLLSLGAQHTEVDASGITPLHKAAAEGHEEVVHLLVEKHGASVNAVSSLTGTPLDAAEASGNSMVISFLKENGGRNSTPADKLGLTSMSE